MANSIEVLHHYSCEVCQGWWSIGLQHVMKASQLYCPWCGHQGHFEQDDIKEVEGKVREH